MLIDGQKGLENFNRVGDVNWRAEGGAIVGDKGKGGHLVSKESYGDFELCAANAYEVNIFDQRPGQEYSTGAIVDFAQIPVPAKYKAGGKWNTMEIHAKGPHVTVTFNGEVTVHMVNDKFKSGPFSLQFGNRGKEPGGAIKWRKVAIKPL